MKPALKMEPARDEEAMKAWRKHCWTLSVALLSTLCVNPSYADPIFPRHLNGRGADLPPGSRCTVEVLNVGGIVFSNGSMFVPNVPVGNNPVRMRATCTDPLGGVTIHGQSGLVNGSPGTRVNAGVVLMNGMEPIASRLIVAPSAMVFSGLGVTQQLTVTSMLPNSGTGNVTAGSTGTTYRTTNAAVAAASPDGLVTAIGPGTAVIIANNEGAVGMAPLTVRSAPLVSLIATPYRVDIERNPAFRPQPVQISLLGVLDDGNVVDMTRATSGIQYSSTSIAIAQVSDDGSIVAVGNGSAFINATDPTSGEAAQVAVNVGYSEPAAVKAYNTPGCAYNVDIDGSRVFVADGDSGLKIYNISNIGTNPSVTPMGSMTFPVTGQSIVQHALDVKVRGHLVAVALGQDPYCVPYQASYPGGGGVALVDVSNPYMPSLLWRTNLPSAVRDLSISGNKLYLASADGLRVYNITNPAAPTTSVDDTMTWLPGSAAAAKAVAADSTRGIVVLLRSNAVAQVFRTNEPNWKNSPTTHDLTPIGGGEYLGDDVIIHGSSAFIANGTGGILELDLTVPSASVLRLREDTTAISATGVALRRTNLGTLVAAADWIYVNSVLLYDRKLRSTYNIDFQSMPGVIRWDANSWGIALGSNFGVVATGLDGIQVFRTHRVTDNVGIAPDVSITDPVGATKIMPGEPFTVQATAVDDVSVARVELLYDNPSVNQFNISIGLDMTAPYSANFSPGEPCSTYTLKASARDELDLAGESLPVQVKTLCLEGQPCSSDSDCANDTCVSGVCQNLCSLIYTSCAELKSACSTAGSGTYTIDADGAAGPQTPFSVYCDMVRAGGGWTLAAKMTNKDAKNWVNAKSSWTATTPYGNAQNLSVDQDAKSAAWGVIAANDIMLSDDPNPLQNPNQPLYIRTLSNCIGGMTLSAFFNLALADYPTPAGQNWFKQCQVEKTYVPGWTYTPNVTDSNTLSPNISLTQDYLTIGRSDETDTYAVVSFYSVGTLLSGPNYDQIEDNTGEYEAQVGLSPSGRPYQPFATTAEAQDIGGPLSCFYSDAMCRADYPQTVFVFIR